MTHPIDRIYDLRQAMKQLRLEHDTIRNQILRGEIDLTGAHNAARIRRSVKLRPLLEVSHDKP